MTQNALLVIDVQESFRQREREWATTANPAVIERVRQLVDAARAAGDLVVWVTHAEPGSDGVFDPVHGHVRVVAELTPAADEIQITKTSINAFTTTSLAPELVTRGIRRVVICGIRTDQCCETTARVAADLGFDVVFVVDATTTSPIEATDEQVGVTGADLIARTAAVLSARGFATVTTTDRWTAAPALS